MIYLTVWFLPINYQRIMIYRGLIVINFHALYLDAYCVKNMQFQRYGEQSSAEEKREARRRPRECSSECAELLTRAARCPCGLECVLWLWLRSVSPTCSADLAGMCPSVCPLITSQPWHSAAVRPASVGSRRRASFEPAPRCDREEMKKVRQNFLH